MKTRHIALSILVLVCTLAQAQVGQKPFPKIEGGSGNDPPPVIFSIPPKIHSAQPCAAEIDRALASARRAFSGQHTTASRTYYDQNVNSWSSASCSSLNVQAMITTADYQLADATEKLQRVIQAAPNSSHVLDRQATVDLFAFSACIVRLAATLCRGSAALPPSSASPSPNRPAPTSPAFPNSSANTNEEAQRLSTQLSEARALALRNQERADQARRGLPKLHKSGSIAHNCLKPQPGGGMLNMCPYAVEYSYCVYRPVKDSWSAAFDCEKSRGGSWQVGPGPNTPVLIHTGGETTYWFACRYGETLHKPDGISPVDIEYQRGRGLLGRCGEWGSSKGK